MQYRRMGRSGLQVSEIALGSSILYPGDNTPHDVGIACIRRAFELGINFFDTADAYERGQNEQVLGEAMRDLPREQLVVATKCWYPVWDGPLGRGLSRKHILEAADASLRRLQTDYIDLYQAHQYDEQTPIEETLSAMDHLVRQGKVLYVGCSNFSAVQLCDANHVARAGGWARFDCIQSPYHLLARDIESDLLPLCSRSGVGVIVYSPLARGLLTGKYKSNTIPAGSSVAAAPEAWRKKYFTAANQTRLRAMGDFAARRGSPMSQIALAWILARHEITSVIIGAQRPEQFEENVGASGLPLSNDELVELEKIFADNVE